MSIEIKNVTKLYGEQKAVNNVSFKVDSGEIVGFLGPNGAGKSTLMKIITGFIPPTQGDAFVKGLNVLENTKEIRKFIGYLPEQNPLYTDMYIAEFLSFIAGIYKIKNKKQRIDEVISLTGLEPEIHKKIGKLSKGFRQRVGLAQAIIHDPEVLILDEATSGLDPNQILEIRSLIKYLGKQKTVLLSTHIMQEVEAICDRIIIINQGMIVADDSRDKIKKQIVSGNLSLTVEFQNPADIETIKNIRGVLSISDIGKNTYTIEFSENIDIRKEIFKNAVDSDNTVLSLQLREKSLEQIFGEITAKNEEK